MSRIVLIGDLHGKTHIYQKMLRQRYAGVRTIQLGDVGLGFKGVGLPVLPDNHKFFRGNHDDPAKCHKHHNYLDVQDWGYLPEDNLFWLAGAFSIDRDYRVEGVSWWPDEELSYQELQKAIGYYEAVKPDFVISHEAPSEVAKQLLMGLAGPYFAAKLDCSMSRTAEALQAMFDLHKPKEWVFGHYHVDKQLTWKDTLFTCVAELSTYDLRIDEKDQKDQKDQKDDTAGPLAGVPSPE